MSNPNPVSELLNQIGWTDLSIGILLVAILQFVLALWIKTRLEASIKHEYAQSLEGLKHEYDRKLEELRFQMKAREQAAKIAELLSQMSNINIQMTKDHINRLNQQIWELSLWLPASTFRSVTECLRKRIAGEPLGGIGIKSVVVAVRKHILQNPDDDLTAEDIPLVTNANNL